MDVNSSNIKQIIAKLIDEKGNPKLPDGWTFLIHGTNTSQWNKDILESDEFVVKGIEAGLYCVERDKAIENHKSGSDVSKIHSQLKQQDGEDDFEIRCLIYKDLRRKKDQEAFAGRLTPEEIKDVNNYHIPKPYYPAIPNNTKLIKLTTTEFDDITNSEKKIVWYVPEKYLEHYIDECGVKTKENIDKNINSKTYGNLQVITERGDNYTKEVRKLNGIEMESSLQLQDGSYENMSKVFVGNNGINVSKNHINYTSYRQQYNAKSNIYFENTLAPVIDDNGNIIGESQYVEKHDMKNGIREGREFKTIEGEKGVFKIESVQIARGDKIRETSTINLNNKLSGKNERIQYSKDDEKETYIYIENGLIGQRIVKDSRGTTIDIYKDGQPYGTFEYDENGKALIQMAGLEQLPDDYVRNQFDIVIPEHEVVSHILPDELYADKVEEKENINEGQNIQMVSTSRLGQETIQEQKDVMQMDKVQSEIEQQLAIGRDNIVIENNERNKFLEKLKVDLSAYDKVFQPTKQVERKINKDKDDNYTDRV